MCRNEWERLSDNRSKKPSTKGAEKGKTSGYIRSKRNNRRRFPCWYTEKGLPRFDIQLKSIGFEVRDVMKESYDKQFSSVEEIKGAPLTGRPIVEISDKFTEIIDIDLHVSGRSITQELKIDHKAVLNHLLEVGFKKKLDVWGPHQLTPKIMIDRISISEALAKQNEIEPLKLG
ncbi:histone-lysine N-methyltransferase SETMAR [Trichonephila clavipes]|nr:histone-lysine N-methyltransferase SETMAR [Trichonephila clavipes]